MKFNLYRVIYGSGPFQQGQVVLMLGEIESMPGHVAVATKDGRVHFAYHADNFELLPAEDV